MDPTADDLDGYDNATVYEDGTVVRVSIRRTDDDAYPSGWRYTLHYGALSAGPETLDDGTIRRYDNSHEDTKGHEVHVAPGPEPAIIRGAGAIPRRSRRGYAPSLNDEFHRYQQARIFHAKHDF